MNQDQITKIKDTMNYSYTKNLRPETFYSLNKDFFVLIKDILLLKTYYFQYTNKYLRILSVARNNMPPMNTHECYEFIKSIYDKLDERSVDADIYFAFVKTFKQYKRLNKKERVQPFKFMIVYMQYNFKDILKSTFDYQKRHSHEVPNGICDSSCNMQLFAEPIRLLLYNKNNNGNYIQFLINQYGMSLKEATKYIKIRYGDVFKYSLTSSFTEKKYYEQYV